MNKANPIIYQDAEKTIFNIFSKHGTFECIVDTEDVDKIRIYKWNVKFEKNHNCFSAIRACPEYKKSPFHLHNFITGYGFVDHIDGDIFNNRKKNLRECTIRQNQKNMKPHADARIAYKGVDEPRPGRFRARIGWDNKNIVIGYFDTPEKAALAYNEKATELHKNFARLNIVK